MASPISLSKILVKTDKVCDYVPVVRILINLVDIFLKATIVPRQGSTLTSGNHYFEHLRGKSYRQSIASMTPVFWNAMAFIFN